MSGRVGDLSPKQEEALAKVSLILAQLWPSPSCWKRLRGTVPAGERPRESRPVAPLLGQCPEGRFSLSVRTSGSLVVAVSSTGSPGGAPWEEVVAWKPSEAAEGTKATFILGAGRDWQRGRGTGAGPQVSSHFREVFLLRGQWHMEGSWTAPWQTPHSLCEAPTHWATLGQALSCVLFDEIRRGWPRGTSVREV